MESVKSNLVAIVILLVSMLFLPIYHLVKYIVSWFSNRHVKCHCLQEKEASKMELKGTSENFRKIHVSVDGNNPIRYSYN